MGDVIITVLGLWVFIKIVKVIFGGWSGWQIFLYRAISAECLAKEEQRATLRSRASLSKKNRRSRLRDG